MNFFRKKPKEPEPFATMDESVYVGIKMSGQIGRPLVLEKLQCSNEPTGAARKSPAELALLQNMLGRERPKQPFEILRKEMTPIGNGIFKKTISKGLGGILKEGVKVTVQYSNMFEFSEGVQHSTYYAGVPFTFILKAEDNGVVPGFEQAVLTMENQEVAHFIVPHQMLYGPKGWPPKIPGGQDSYLIIEIIKVSEVIPVKDQIRLHNDFNETFAKVGEIRGKAKIASDGKFYQAAADYYCEAITLLQDVLVQCADENQKRLELLLILFFDAAVAYDNLDQLENAVSLYAEMITLVGKDIRISTELKGKFYLHAARAFRKIDCNEVGFKLLIDARQILNSLGICSAEVEEEYQALYRAYKFEVESDEAGKHVQDVAYDKPELHRNKATVRATFDRMIKDFKESSEKTRSIFGFQSDAYDREAKAVASAKNVKLNAKKLQNGTTCYFLKK